MLVLSGSRTIGIYVVVATEATILEVWRRFHFLPSTVHELSFCSFGLRPLLSDYRLEYTLIYLNFRH